MRGLLLKDFYSIRSYFKQLGILLIMMAGIAFVLHNSALLAYMLIFMSMSLVQSCMAIDEKNHWERYALTMPICKKEIVRSKYILLLIMGGGAAAAAIVLNMLMSLFFHAGIRDSVISSAAVFVVYLYIFSFSIPAAFKLGADKGRYITMAVIVIPALGISALFQIFPGLEGMLSFSDTQVIGICAGGVIFGIVLFVLSYCVSLKIYQGKEF